MKNHFKNIAVSALMLLVSSVSAQENYTIKSNLKVEGLPAEYAAFGEQEIVTYIKGDKLKTEYSSMMGTNTVFFDGQNVTSLMDQMGNKSGFKATKAEIDANDKNEKSEKPKIEYTTEKKTIAGYECTKALITTVKEKKENVSTVWFTDKIKTKNPTAGKSNKGMLDLSELKGYPLSMEMAESMQGTPIKMIMLATEVITAPLEESVFTVNTDGYKMMTYKEMQDKQKAMKAQGH